MLVELAYVLCFDTKHTGGRQLQSKNPDQPLAFQRPWNNTYSPIPINMESPLSDSQKGVSSTNGGVLGSMLIYVFGPDPKFVCVFVLAS